MWIDIVPDVGSWLLQSMVAEKARPQNLAVTSANSFDSTRIRNPPASDLVTDMLTAFPARWHSRRLNQSRTAWQEPIRSNDRTHSRGLNGFKQTQATDRPGRTVTTHSRSPAAL